MPLPARPWKGFWLMAVSAVHTVFGVVVFSEPLVRMVRRGVFNTVGEDAMLGAVAWFLLFGFVLFLAGLAIAELENASRRPLPRSLGWALLFVILVGVVLMPVSGFWLALPPAMSLAWGKNL